MAEDDIWDTWEDFTDCHVRKNNFMHLTLLLNLTLFFYLFLHCQDVDKHLEQRLNRNSNFKLENGDVSHGSQNNSGNFNNDLNGNNNICR